MSEFRVWPYAPLNGDWSIPDDILAYVWGELVEQNKVKQVFWAGGVTTFDGFVNFLQRNENHPVVLMDMKQGVPVVLAWLNGVEGKHALAHFVVLGPIKDGYGETILEYWGEFTNGNGRRVVEVLLGFIPETNMKAIRCAETIGFKTLGTIPRLCELPYEGGKLVGGTVVYYDWGGK
jgi:hypothetical protein